MADKITKLLKKLPPKQLRLLLPVVGRIAANNLEGLDVKALKGQKPLFRVRAGNYRVIFSMQNGNEPKIISIGKRNKKTYKDL